MLLTVYIDRVRIAMKEPQWDDSINDSNEHIEAAVLLADDEANEIDNAPGKTALPKTQFTDLRRRIEERLDGKRIDHEFEYDDLDGLLDIMS